MHSQITGDPQNDTRSLTDVLDDFTPNPPAKPAPQNTKVAGPALPPAAPTQPPDAADVNFVEELARGMEAMLLEMETHQNPSSAADGASTSDTNAGGDTARDKQLLAAWEDLFAKGMAGVSPEVPAGAESEDAFQKSLQEATERLRRSDTELQVAGCWPMRR